MKDKIRIKGLAYVALLCITMFLIGCGAATETTVTTNTENQDNATAEKTDKDGADKTADKDAGSDSSVFAAKEPEKYQAKVNVKLEPIGGGDLPANFPKLEAMVAKDGANKRMEFNAPNGQKLVYLEIGGKNLLVLPDKKQYAEINKDAVGFEVRSLMTPEQIVKRAKNIKGLEKVGEEKYNDRDAVKYKYSAVTDTKTKAGDVETDSFLFVDKETGLPLKTEISSVSQDASVQGIKGVKVVTEMSDVKTDVSEDLFKQPEDFEKIEEEQIRNQLNLIFNVAGQFLKQMMQNANNN